MNSFLIFVLGILAGGVITWLFACKNAGTSEKTLGLIERQTRERDKNKRKIIEFFESQSSSAEAAGGQGKVTNNDIEAMFGVSDATATRYLEELEKEGKIRQVGKTGKHVYYEKTRR